LPLGSLKLYLYAGAALVVILGLGFSHYKAYSHGVTVTENKYIKVIAEVNSKSADLLKQQKDEHDRFVEQQDKLLNSLKTKNSELNKIVRENEEQASKEPDRDEPGIGKSRVMRLNRIR
jgi:hypothetical protein